MTLAYGQTLSAAPSGKPKSLTQLGVIGGQAGVPQHPAPLGLTGGATGGYTSALATVPTYHGSVAQQTAPGPVAQTADYGEQLKGDYGYQQALAAINAQGTTNAGNLTAAQQRALAQYGQIPDNLGSVGGIGDVSGAINQTTRDLANAATSSGVSTVAQLQKAYANQQQADNASLAARGMLRSGALGQHANLDLTAYQQSQYDATQKLLDYLGSVYQNYLGLQSQGQSAAADATNQALQRIIAQINAGQGPATAAPNGSGGDSQPSYGTEDFLSPGSGPDQGYVPDGTVTSPTTISAPSGGQYISGGGTVAYKSNKGVYGGKSLL